MTVKIVFSLLIIISTFLFSCEKREDVYKIDNEAPLFEISSSATLNSSSLEVVKDSFNYAVKDYYINFKITDDTKNISLTYTVDNAASVELINQETIVVDDKFVTTGVLKIVPIYLGFHNINLTTKDPYNSSKNISVLLKVYQVNMIPILNISTGANVGSNYVGFVNINIKDTFNLAQGNIFIDYKIIDDNVNYNFYFTTVAPAVIVELTSFHVLTFQTYTVTENGRLKLTPYQIGNHIVTLTVTDDITQSTTLIAEIYIQ